MSTDTLTKSSSVSSAYALTESPLQVVISKDSDFSNKAILIVLKETATPDEYIPVAGTEMTAKLSYSWDLKPANYKVELYDADPADSVVVDLT